MNVPSDIMYKKRFIKKLVKKKVEIFFHLAKPAKCPLGSFFLRYKTFLKSGIKNSQVTSRHGSVFSIHTFILWNTYFLHSTHEIY